MTTFTYFVSSVDGLSGDNGSTWALAKDTIANAFAQAVTDAATSGDTVIIKVSHLHDFTATAAITWTPIAGVKYFGVSVDRANGDAWTAGAKESVGAASAAFSVASVEGSAVVLHGLTINGGTNASINCDISLLVTGGTTSCRLTAINCTFDLKAASTGAQLITGPAVGVTDRASKISLVDCTFIVSGSRAGTAILLQEADVEIVNPTFSMTGATKPAVLFGSAVNLTCNLTIRDGDASGYSVSSGAYFDAATLGKTKALLKNLRTSSTPSLTTGTWAVGVGSITLRNVDSGDTINTFEFRNMSGTLTENTSVYATGGASFNSAGISWEIVTTAACNEFFPFVLPSLHLWNTVTSAQTATVEFANNSATALTDAEIWLELSYPASASFPNYANDDDRDATPYIDAGTDQATSANGWTGLGGTNTQQKATVAFTAAEKGLLEGRIVVTKASQTLYVDPLLKVA